MATLPEALWQVDIFSPNQTEARLLTGIEPESFDAARVAGERLLALGPKIIVLNWGRSARRLSRAKRRQGRGGEGGCAWGAVRACAGHEHPGGCGYDGGRGFVYGCAGHCSGGRRALTDAVRFAGIAGSLACTRAGAQAAIPSRDEILAHF